MAYSSSASSSLMTTLSSSVIDHKDKCVHVQDRLGRSTSLTAPIPEEVDVYLSQLKSKRAVQDEDMSTGGKCAEVLSSPEVSHVIRILFGEEKKELKPETREVLKNLENFAKEFIKATNTTNGSKAMEALMEVAHTHDNLIFRQVVGNEPVDWATAGFPVFEGNARKELLKERVIKDVDTKRAARRELAKNTGLVKKELEELKVVRVKREEKIKPDNLRRLHIALDSYKGQADKLKVLKNIFCAKKLRCSNLVGAYHQYFVVGCS